MTLTKIQQRMAVTELMRRIGLGLITLQIDNWDDRSTWQIAPDENVTPDQRAAAQEVIAAFDPDAFILAEEKRRASIRDDESVRKINDLARSKSSEQIDRWLSNNVRTIAQARKVIGAIIKSLAVPPM